MTRRGSRFSRVLRTVAWALLLAFAFGFLIGTWLRSELEKPVRYIGARFPVPVEEPAILRFAIGPGNVGQSESRILMPRQNEEQVRESIQIAQRRVFD